MKNLLFILFAGILLVSCEKEQEITSVELYYKGRTVLHSTFHVSLKFFSEGELVLDMLLWSLDSTLESGRYTICPDKVSGAWKTKGNVNKTFSRDACFWRGELIKDGYVDVLHDGDTYTFDINLIDAKGENHQVQYSGKVVSKRSPQITENLGFFHTLHLEKSTDQTNGNMDAYKMFLITGDLLDVYYRQLFIVFVPESATGIEGHYSIGESNVPRTRIYRSAIPGPEGIPFKSGTFSITRTDTYPTYRVDIDATTEDGERIRGSYINGEFYDQYGF